MNRYYKFESFVNKNIEKAGITNLFNNKKLSEKQRIETLNKWWASYQKSVNI